MVLSSFVFCSLNGRPAFLVWWLAFCGIVLIGFSIFLSNLPYRLIKPEMSLSRFATLWACGFLVAGAILISLSPAYADPLYLLFLDPAGATMGVLFCQWIHRKGILAWIH
ncbi:hypothetical protein SAMN05428958_102538 [Pantoea sesami]|nr:hypothetical protein SAMN05428958_102538 [Pantoea sesami]